VPVVALDSATALVVVDVQNDFADPRGSLYVHGGEEIVPVVNALVNATAKAGGQVFYTQDWHPETTPHFVEGGGTWPRHCVRDTWGAALHPDLVVIGPVIQKGTNGEDGYSGFSMRSLNGVESVPTELNELLVDAGAERLVLVGLALDVCVKATAEDALDHGYAVTIVENAVAAVEIEPGDGVRAVEELLARGVTIS